MSILNRSCSVIALIAMVFAVPLLSSKAFATQVPGKLPSLGFDDPMQMEFIKLTEEQGAAIQKIHERWKQAYSAISKEDRRSRECRKTYGKYQAECRAKLSDEQLLMWRRFNLITNYGPTEISLLDRTISIGDPGYTAEQSKQLLRVRKDWVDLVARKFSNMLDLTREEESELLANLTKQHGTGIRNKIFEILTNDQVNRFSQLEWQTSITLSGVYIFSGGQADETLIFADDQRQLLQEILNGIKNAPSRFEAVGLRIDGYKKLFNSLSKDQKKIWREKLGAPANVSNVTWLTDFMKEDLASLESERE